MEMKGEVRIPAPREKVWEALNDPEVLKASIPGCETLEKTGNDSFEATVQAKVGPVKAKFKGAVTLSDIDPPNGYTITGEGKGGAAGFAKGGAKVKLTDDGQDTLLTYEVDAKVGGKLAQIGSRLIDSTASKMAGEFFDSFARQVSGGEPADAVVSEAEPHSGSEEGAETAPEPEQKPVQETTPAGDMEADTGEERSTSDGSGKKAGGMSPMTWAVLLVLVVLVLILVFSR